jgi:hypothetical protein
LDLVLAVVGWVGLGSMEKWSRGLSCRAAICGIVVLLCATAFSCSLAAEFRKVKVRLACSCALRRRQWWRAGRSHSRPWIWIMSVCVRRRRT